MLHMRGSLQSLAGALFAAAFLLMQGPARAQDPTVAETRAIEALISSQIDAFRSDDSTRAYSFASPVLQRQFVNPETFMSMVKGGYQPVYRPKSVAFGRLREMKGNLVQEVFVVGPDGKDWTALYAVEQQPDGSWRISGCKLLDEPRVSA